MSPSNNPEIDQKQLAAKLNVILTSRRRQRPLIEELPDSVSLPDTSPQSQEYSTIRNVIKALPWIGPIVLRMYRRMRNIAAPGLHWKQRFRLLPLLGPFTLWVYGVVRLNAIRHDIALQLDELRRLQQSHQLATDARLNQLEAELRNRTRAAQVLEENTQAVDPHAN